jgi:hypothetical protein
MSSVRCDQCGAAIPLPDDVGITKLSCKYCGAERVAPDAEARRRALLDERRAKLEEERAAAERAERADDKRERHEEKKQHRRGMWATRLTSLLAVLAAPVIVSITVFDLPARLGYGASGADRVAQMTAQLEHGGCTVLQPATSLYTSGSVSQLVTVEDGCLRVLAAGGEGHRDLSLRLFSDGGKELAHSANSSDPQLSYCARASTLLRYQIDVAPAAKGRLTHTALRCAAEPTKKR